jgi:hypothetical protein
VQRLDERLIAAHEAVPDRLVHEFAKGTELLGGDIRSFLTQAAEHLVQDLVSPLGLDEAALRDAYE